MKAAGIIIMMAAGKVDDDGSAEYNNEGGGELMIFVQMEFIPWKIKDVSSILFCLAEFGHLRVCQARNRIQLVAMSKNLTMTF